MPSRDTWLKALGFGAGVAAAYGLYRAGRRLQSQCPPAPRPMYADAREMLADLGYYWRRPEEMAGLYHSGLLAHPFAAKIALAALGDGNGQTRLAQCRVSARLAYLYGILRGLALTEVRSLLEGRTDHATAGEAPALLFAQHYSHTEGTPDPAMVLGLVEAYGERGANDLLGYLRVLLLVQRIARSLDALVSRLVSRPRPDSTLVGELSVVLVALVGVIPLVPVMRWRALHAAGVGGATRPGGVTAE
jgi:hypothetical protein